MIRLIAFVTLLACPLILPADETRKGYVLKSDEGEVTWAGTRIKASEETGTRGIEVLIWPAPEGASTGLHYHVEADEYFFIISGNGTLNLGTQNHDFGPGDFIFVPAGVDHRLDFKNPVQVFEFLDRPNQVGELRAWHRKYGDSPAMSVEQMNKVAQKFGTVYKTID